jgi:hypothetical protein
MPDEQLSHWGGKDIYQLCHRIQVHSASIINVVAMHAN